MSPQIQRLRVRLLRVDFSLITADTLFRAPVARQDDQSNRKEICPDWRRGPHHHMGLWDIGRLPYRKTVPHRNRPQASGPNPWIKEPRRDVATDTTPSRAPVESRFLTDHRWHVIQSPCSPAGRSVLFWRGDRFICPTCIGLPFGLQHTVWANQRKTRRQSLSGKHWGNTATKVGQIVPEYQTHLNLTGRLRMISRLSMDCSWKLNGL